MQTFLLTLATAVILAIVAAFAAPAYVDWGQWRGHFEQQIGRAIGAPVALRGSIEAEILPVPRVLLRNVVVGRDPAGTGMIVGELRGSLSLGALIRGEIAIEDIRLVEPRARLVLGADGTVQAPRGAVRPGGFSIAALEVEDGTVELVDPSGVLFHLDDVDLRGEVGGPQGPFRLEGEVAQGGVREGVRLSLGSFSGGVSRGRLSLQGLSSPRAFTAEGTFSLAGGTPGFDGRASLAMRADATAASPLARAGWNLTGTVRARRTLVEAGELALSLGNAERPVELTGSGRLAYAGGRSRLDLALSARQIDLNAATAGGAPLAVMMEIGGALAPLAGVAPSGSIGLASDTVLVGGAQMRELRAELGWDGPLWQVKALQAKLPGRSSLRLSGEMSPAAAAAAAAAAPAGFAGTLAFDTEDVPAFASWALPGAVGLVASLPPGAASLRGTVAATPGLVSLDEARLVLPPVAAGAAGLALSGGLSVASPEGAPTRIEARLAANGAELDPLVAPARRLLAMGGQTFDVALAFSAGNARLSGLPVQQVEVKLATGPAKPGVAVERLALKGFGGLDVEGAGRLAGAETLRDGSFEARLTGAAGEGLAALARLLRPDAADTAMVRLAPLLQPLDVRLKLEGADDRSSLTLEGSAGPLSGQAQMAFGAGAATGSATLDMADGAAVLTRLGVPGLRAGLGPARLLLRLTPDLDAELMLGGAHVAARGDPGLDAEGGPRPNLQIEAQADDLARLLPLVADAADPGTAVPLALTGTLTRPPEANGAWRLAGLAGTLAGQRIEGSALYGADRPDPVSLELRLDRWSLGRALALVAGRVLPGPGVAWTDARFAPAPLAGIAGSAALTLGRLDLPNGTSLTDARLRARMADGQAVIEEIAGGLAGGRLNASGKLRRRGDVAEMEGHLTLTGADLPQLLAPYVAAPALRGRIALGLDLAGRGRSVAALVQTLAGQGSLAVEGLEIGRLDPAALRQTMLATDRLPPQESARIAEMLEQGLARGPLRIPRLDVSLSVLNGVVRTGTARYAEGGQRVALDGSLDLPRLAFDATVDLDDATDPAATAPPGAVVSWRGPLASPERRLDITALNAAINMRTLERETKRLEQQYGRAPRPAAPADPSPQAASPVVVPQQAAPAASPQPAPAQPATPAPASPARTETPRIGAGSSTETTSPLILQPAPLRTQPVPQLAPPATTTPAAPSGASETPYVPPFLMQPDALTQPAAP
ncbi:AsmA family protein [Ancylobacter lacus]|uniref:AsmA family protein n=1 Tax=Ancylobacter lacus TaxID=2579970 RepID=UPI001BCADAFC|nr:AsmA family protein [Ancylobacter lacus]